MDKTSKKLGDIAELKAILRFSGLGYRVSIPFGDNCKYDLIVDTGSELWRVQVKTARKVKGSISFALRWKTSVKGKSLNVKYTSEMIDKIVGYYPVDDTLYMLDMKEINPTAEINLRVDPTKNNQKKGVIWAKDHIL